MYASYLARSLVPTSVCQYLNFVGLLHKELGLPNPLLDNWFLSSVLKGIKRIHGVPPTPREPMTIRLLFQIRGRLNLNNSHHASFWAICLTSFFGLFRKAHLLPISSKSFSPVTQFTRNDFSLHAHGYNVHVRWSKTIQLGQHSLHVPFVRNPGSVLCPVTAISQAFWLTKNADPYGQAFCYASTSTSAPRVFTYKMFMSYLKRFLQELGAPANLFGSHSFRRGGASFALEAGIPLDTISIMGDWKSDAMFLYLHMPFAQRLSA